MRDTYSNIPPHKAAFDDALRVPGSFLHKLLKMMGEVYGIDYLILVLYDEDSDIQANAAWALG